ncbi:MAG: glycosyltransferase [Bacteroidales bacterium]
MTIAILLDNPFVNDRRVFREVTALAGEGYSICLFGVKSNTLPEVEHKEGYLVKRIFEQDIYNIKQQYALRKYLKPILDVNPRVIHCHDQNMLHIGVLLKQQNPDLYLVYDSHELFHAWPLNLTKFGDPWLFLKSWLVRKYQVMREKRNARHINSLITVNKSLADDLKAHFRLKDDAVVLRNIPEKELFHKDTGLLRQEFSLPQSTRILVFIGSAIYLKTLNLEQVIEETANVENLAFIIICGEQGGKKDLMNWVKTKAYAHVFFHPLLKPSEIGPYLASCDVGLVPTWNRNDLSYWYALDNKLFEYMMSGIPILSTKQPEYIAIVEQYGIGICVDPDQPGAYRDGLLKIFGSLASFREPLEKACDILNWDNEKQHLLQLYRQINTL